MAGSFELDLFIESVERLRMPVKFMKEVQRMHDIGHYQFKMSAKVNMVQKKKNIFWLMPDIVTFLNDPPVLYAPSEKNMRVSEINRLGSDVNTMYHECTHAYMDIMLERDDELVKRILKSSE